jgi:hypothetical protein
VIVRPSFSRISLAVRETIVSGASSKRSFPVLTRINSPVGVPWKVVPLLSETMPASETETRAKRRIQNQISI